MKETTAATPTPHRLTAEHRELLDRVLDKWSLQVLDTLCEGPRRFNELRREIPAVTQKSLTAALRRLERNGMIERAVISTRPVAVEYRISDVGASLQDLIDALYAWTTATLPEINRARARFDADTTPEG
ncbi:winged helix-turn-helix transcriptional regulator [Myceligenerans pegani]|uniref:Helix-turn-helix transcriptional regulator n=1 Tax=Myceligenerans pegani TaxID=2776917 RepID=A0ABR9N574_9MICO|nr:helix-turn-helix domain-containing protein [Myceligenerans sp. TRM 65318]MBE1878822.1 helix-turn-helix transcriptional regulator [Myceligenerans sp. TRM 65318]MBE3021093.1 helix-turn-helix transcriptional regulator [Myceligenerans sp. TRM 65318]